MSRSPLNPDFDPRLADFLESGPDRAPTGTLGTVLAAFPSLPQRRGSRPSWRPGTINRSLVAAAALVTAAAVVLSLSGLAPKPPSTDPGGPASPSADALPSASHSPAASVAASPVSAPSSSSDVPPMTEQLASRSARLTIRYPKGWTVQRFEAGQPADGLVIELLPSDPRQQPLAVLSASSEQIAARQAPAEWLALQKGGCSEPRYDITPRDVVIGDREGRLLASGCPLLGGRFHYLAIAVAAGRGYTFHLDSRLSTIDESWFTAVLASVSFEG